MEMPGRKRNIRILSGLFIALLIGFTLFGNTLTALTLPKVAIITPSRGELVHTFQGGGVVKWKAEAALSGKAGGKAAKVEVKEGDRVAKGQALVVYDQKAAEYELLDEQAALDKLKLAREELQISYVTAVQSGDEMSVTSAGRTLKVSAIDIGMQQRRIGKLQEEMAASGALVAPFDGIVTKVNAVEGLASSGGGPDVIVADVSLGFAFEFMAPADAVADLAPDAKLDVQVKGGRAGQVEGRIEGIEDAGSSGQEAEGAGTDLSNTLMKRLHVTIQDDSLQGGERAEVELTRTTTDMLLVPNTAIRDEGGKKYVYSVEERQGPLGNAFYVAIRYITIADKNDTQSAVSQGLFEQERIVLESGEPLQEGDRVRVH